MTLQLIVTAGLPGSGKSSVAETLGRSLGWPVLSVDPVEAAMRRAGLPPEATGLAAYTVAEAAAEVARAAWRRLAGRRGAALTFVECACLDPGLHCARVEARVHGLIGLPEVTWARVEARRAEYDPWAGADDQLAFDTARTPLPDIVVAVLAHLAARGGSDEMAVG